MLKQNGGWVHGMYMVAVGFFPLDTKPAGDDEARNLVAIQTCFHLPTI